MALTRIKTDNILDGEVRQQDLADGSVTFNKILITGGVGAGEVLKTDGTGGLFWELATGSSTSLDTLTDVDTTGKLDGDSLVYDLNTDTWKPGSNVPSSLGLNSLVDVTLTPLAQNEFLKFDGFDWVNDKVSVIHIESIQPVAVTGLINDLIDVNVVGATVSQRLGFDGAQWRAVDAAQLDSIDNFADVDTSTVPAVNGDALIFDGGDSIWKPVATGLGSSSNNFVVQNITARDALSPADGDTAFVRDGATLSEWEMYIWDAGAGPAAWILISTSDSAATDARTIAGDIDVTTISPVLLGNVSPESRVTLVSIDVSVAFDGSPVLTVGTDGSPTTNAELASDAELDLSVTGIYTIVTDVQYNTIPDQDIKAYFAVGGATVGNARVLVTYV